jgi:hypothetical protein
LMSARQAALTAHANNCNNTLMQNNSTFTTFPYVRNTKFKTKLW